MRLNTAKLTKFMVRSNRSILRYLSGLTLGLLGSYAFRLLLDGLRSRERPASLLLTFVLLILGACLGWASGLWLLLLSRKRE